MGSRDWTDVTHGTAGDCVLDAGALFEAGWPGERIAPESARNLIHVNLAELRKVGLRDLLLRSRGSPDRSSSCVRAHGPWPAGVQATMQCEWSLSVLAGFRSPEIPYFPPHSARPEYAAGR